MASSAALCESMSFPSLKGAALVFPLHFFVPRETDEKMQSPKQGDTFSGTEKKNFIATYKR